MNDELTEAAIYAAAYVSAINNMNLNDDFYRQEHRSHSVAMATVNNWNAHVRTKLERAHETSDGVTKGFISSDQFASHCELVSNVGYKLDYNKQQEQT